MRSGSGKEGCEEWGGGCEVWGGGCEEWGRGM